MGVGTVSVNDGGGAVSAAFTVNAAPAPSGITFVPTIGPIGTFLKITGANFTCASAVTVGAGDTAVTALNVVSASEIRATVDAGTSTGLVKVTTPGNAAVASAGTFTVNATAPVINSFSPTSGAVGTVINVIGQNFTNPPTVRINGVLASATFLSSTSLNVAVPSTTSGLITVTATGGTATSLDAFTVTGSTIPTITSFSPTSGAVGTSVTINGTNFLGATFVRFNGVSATPFTVNVAGTQITTTVPSGATTGKIR